MAEKVNSAQRKKMHVRSITCSAYEREDGLFDVEAFLTDTKTFDISHPDGSAVPAGEPLHEIVLRVTMDGNLVIQDVVANTLRSPYRECPDITERYRQLIGVQIGSGFTRKVRDLFRAANGCTHITELLPVIATTAYQALFTRMAMAMAKSIAIDPVNKESLASPIGGCYALRQGGEADLRRKAKAGGK